MQTLPGSLSSTTSSPRQSSSSPPSLATLHALFDQLKHECTVTPQWTAPNTLPSTTSSTRHSYTPCSHRVVPRPKYRVTKSLFPDRAALRKDIEERISQMHQQEVMRHQSGECKHEE